jgi:hypothetical protein
MIRARLTMPWKYACGYFARRIGNIWAVALTLRQPYRCMVPAHGSSLKPPPDTTPDDAGDPSRVVFCLDGPSE